MKSRKSFISLVLVFAMIFSLNIAPVVANAEEVEEGRGCSITIQTPYQMYFPLKPNEPASTLYAYMTSEDLKDDFGLGLKEEQGYSVLRATAKAIRNYLIEQGKAGTSTDVYDKENQAAANAMLKDYIDGSWGEYGFSMRKFSPDGQNWNPGITKDGSDGAGIVNGSWMCYVDGEMANLNIGEFQIPDSQVGSDVKLVWVPYDPECGYATLTPSIPNDWVMGVGDTFTYTATKQVYDENWNLSTVPVSGASVQVYYEKQDKYLDTEITTDENGKFSFTTKNAGNYYFVCREEATKDGVTFSKTNAAVGYLAVIAKPAAAKNVKAKVSGKKKAKKKTVTLTWKNSNKYAGASTLYTVYRSKKKNSGYKKVATGTGEKTKVTIKKVKKGTYYFKILTTEMWEYDIDDPTSVKYIKGSYTKPLKVKVK